MSIESFPLNKKETLSLYEQQKKSVPKASFFPVRDVNIFNNACIMPNCSDECVVVYMGKYISICFEFDFQVLLEAFQFIVDI